MALVINKATQKQAEIITQILSLAFQEFKEKYTAKAFRSTVISPDEVQVRMREGIVWIAILDDKPIGTVSGKIMSRTFYIQGMGVLPSGRGKKIGFKLLQTVEQYAKDHHCEELLLNTTPYLKKAIRLYENFGFQIINEPPYELFKTPLFNMKKSLKTY